MRAAENKVSAAFLVEIRLHVTYKLEPSDIGTFQRHWWRHKSGVRPVRLYVAALLLIAIAWLGLPRGWASLVISFVVPLVVVLSVMPLILILTRTAQAKSMPDVLQVQTVSIEPEFLLKTGELGESKLRWQGVYEVLADDHLIYFYTNKRMAHLVPKRAFHSAEEAQIFLNTATECWKAAKSGLPPPAIPPETAWPPPPTRG